MSLTSNLGAPPWLSQLRRSWWSLLPPGGTLDSPSLCPELYEGLLASFFGAVSFSSTFYMCILISSSLLSMWPPFPPHQTPSSLQLSRPEFSGVPLLTLPPLHCRPLTTLSHLESQWGESRWEAVFGTGACLAGSSVIVPLLLHLVGNR